MIDFLLEKYSEVGDAPPTNLKKRREEVEEGAGKSFNLVCHS